MFISKFIRKIQCNLSHFLKDVQLAIRAENPLSFRRQSFANHQCNQQKKKKQSLDPIYFFFGGGSPARYGPRGSDEFFIFQPLFSRVDQVMTRRCYKLDSTFFFGSRVDESKFVQN